MLEVKMMCSLFHILASRGRVSCSLWC